VSGAATLATALAVNADRQLGHDRDALVQAAHRAEVAAGTGLGDVFIQERGGLVWDLGEGLRHAGRAARVEYVSFGEVATAEVLGNEGAMERVVDVGTSLLDTLDPTGPLAPLFDASWRFADRVGLATEPVSAAVADVQEAGGAATMAMVGETVVATGVEGALPNATRIAEAGARLH
jgi:pantoate kinase